MESNYAEATMAMRERERSRTAAPFKNFCFAAHTIIEHTIREMQWRACASIASIYFRAHNVRMRRW